MWKYTKLRFFIKKNSNFDILSTNVRILILCSYIYLGVIGVYKVENIF